MDRFDQDSAIQESTDSLLSKKRRINNFILQEEESDNYQESFLNMCRQIAQKNERKNKSDNLENKVKEMEKESNSCRKSQTQIEYQIHKEIERKENSQLERKIDIAGVTFKPNYEWNNYKQIEWKEGQQPIMKADQTRKNKKDIKESNQKQVERKDAENEKNEKESKEEKQSKMSELTEEENISEQFRKLVKKCYPKKDGIKKVRRTIIDEVFYEDPEMSKLSQKTKRVIIEQGPQKKQIRKYIRQIQQMLTSIVNLY